MASDLKGAATFGQRQPKLNGKIHHQKNATLSAPPDSHRTGLSSRGYLAGAEKMALCGVPFCSPRISGAITVSRSGQMSMWSRQTIVSQALSCVAGSEPSNDCSCHAVAATYHSVHDSELAFPVPRPRASFLARRHRHDDGPARMAETRRRHSAVGKTGQGHGPHRNKLFSRFLGLLVGYG